MSLYAMLKPNGPSGFGYASTAEEVSAGIDLSGKRILVTGANSGLGLETMRVLALRGATVIAAARTLEKADIAAGSVSGSTESVACELGDPGSVRAAVAELKGRDPLDGIVANAGIMALPERQLLHGYERQFFVNHVGHFMLVTGLLEHLSATARVVMLSSSGHTMAFKDSVRFDDLAADKEYSDWKNYGQSKLCNLLFARELARRFGDSGKVAFGVHPGVIDTNLGRHMKNPLMGLFKTLGPLLVLKSIPQGAATQTWAMAHPEPLHKDDHPIISFKSHADI